MGLFGASELQGSGDVGTAGLAAATAAARATLAPSLYRGPSGTGYDGGRAGDSTSLMGDKGARDMAVDV